jgi:hypothetical protein
MGNLMVTLASLGLCEHCNALITIQGLPAEAMDAVWKCEKCGGVFSEKTFGFEKGKKVRWVGEEGRWVDEKPTRDFQLGKFYVVQQYPRYLWQ